MPVTAVTEPLLRPEIDFEKPTQERCHMSSDTILDLAAAAVVAGGFLIAAYWDIIRDGILRTQHRADRSGGPLSHS